ncbi:MULTISPECIES: P-loop NTPase fold protein [unclassified Arcicella]|uniref:KAP family P-loop NTPase fold protein n=1 Tax=unclassified Arcicella TaxID=2644986 RepID=UPI002864875C|nr:MULTISPECIES: P-loop NTPase fold protein [unclassified Arcicella]MDR6564221.1 putative KAP-like P-loop ATPase [Arcicella sp. BE51]MDR6811532.1 putative KAP-like P-loop ATPase [Arcicella sp. BE140]MDR6823058.1 putative KAP-like P-loop ATPase [Arcicella sp. BE139]
MWADNETSEDLLGFKVHADLLINVINDESVLPITIGVFGDWGSGKSSVLQIVKEEFDKDEDKDSLCIYFNGWTFEGYDDAKAALLNSILKELENNKKISAEIKHTIKEKAKKLWKSIDWIRGAGMVMKNVALPAVSAYFTGGLSLVPFAIQKLTEWGDNPEKIIEKLQSEEGQKLFKALVKEEKEGKKHTNVVAEFREDFKELLKATNFKRLVVIIDDLDRCSPERIIENLEAIKLFLNVPKTAFIIGADPRIVKYAIEHKYRNNKEIEEDNNRIVIDYLEKLIQLPYSLPRLSESEVETYISMLICKKEIGATKFENVLNEFKKYRLKNRYSTFGLSNFEKILEAEAFGKVKDNVITIPSLVPLITNSLYGNPRQIKRFLNTYTIRKRLAEVASLESFNDAVLAKMMILEYSEPKLFRKLFEWQIIQDGVPKEITEIETKSKEKSIDDVLSEMKDSDFKEWSKPKIIKWFQIEPLLSGVDLRDYYWIARDKLENSITATSMIPPVVRALFNELLPDNMTATVTKSLLSEKFQPFSDIEKDAFFNIISSNLKRNPQQKRLYDIFNIMTENKIENTVYHYIEALKIISVSDIEPAVATRLADFKSEPEIGEFLIDYFKDGKSRASKAFNLKK